LCLEKVYKPSQTFSETQKKGSNEKPENVAEKGILICYLKKSFFWYLYMSKLVKQTDEAPNRALASKRASSYKALKTFKPPTRDEVTKSQIKVCFGRN